MKSATRSLIIFKKPRKMTNDSSITIYSSTRSSGHHECLTNVKAEANQSNISSSMAFFPCWMKCWISFADSKICEKIENRVG